jgi:hypothetical protein
MEVVHMAAAMVVVAMATQVVPVAHHHGGNSVGGSSTEDGSSHLFSHGIFFLFFKFSQYLHFRRVPGRHGIMGSGHHGST